MTCSSFLLVNLLRQNSARHPAHPAHYFYCLNMPCITVLHVLGTCGHNCYYRIGIIVILLRLLLPLQPLALV